MNSPEEWKPEKEKEEGEEEELEGESFQEKNTVYIFSPSPSC